ASLPRAGGWLGAPPALPGLGAAGWYLAGECLPGVERLQRERGGLIGGRDRCAQGGTESVEHRRSIGACAGGDERNALDNGLGKRAGRKARPLRDRRRQAR